MPSVFAGTSGLNTCLDGRAHVVVPLLSGPEHELSNFDHFPFRLTGAGAPSSVSPSTIATTLVGIPRGHGLQRQQASDFANDE